MPGFCLTNFDERVFPSNIYEKNCVRHTHQYKNIWCGVNTLDKFLDDKTYFEDQDIIVLIEGVVFNKRTLIANLNTGSWNECLKCMYNQYGEAFYSNFRGSFSGFLFDKKQQKLIVWTNHCGDNVVFYYIDDNNFIFGTQVNYIIDTLKKNNISTSLNEKSVLDMLVYGFMEDNNTYAKEIKRLLPGQYFTLELNDYSNRKWSVNTYYTVGMYPTDVKKWTEKQIIDKLDELFCDAVKLEYDKDVEYGYAHLTDLSGGLDSRMNTIVANELRYNNITNVSYSMAGYLDETIPQKIAADLKIPHLFLSLDDAGFMLDIDTNISMNYGLAMYSFITGGGNLLKRLNNSMYGLEHTGQLGDVIVGSYIHNKNENAIIQRAGYTSNRYLQILNGFKINHYENKEQYMIMVRGMLGILNSHLIRRNYIEVASPFLDVDFMEFCMSIPVEYRIDHKLYFTWINQKHPSAQKYKWEKTGLKPGTSLLAVKTRKFCKRCIMFCIHRTFLKRIVKEKHMNPMGMWYEKRSDIRNYWDNYFAENIENAVLDEKITSILKEQYYSGNVYEKMQVLTVLGAVKLFF